MSDKKPRLITPIGEAKWAHVHTPKPPFKDASGRTQGEPKYQIDVCFKPDDPEWKTWAEKVMAQVRALPEQVNKRTGERIPKQTPIKKEFDENDQPTGRFYVTFKTSDKFKPQVFDKFGRLVAPEILVGNGSKVKVNYCENTYDTFGGGVNFYLNAVQVLELVEFKKQTADAYGFSTEALPPQADNSDPQSFPDCGGGAPQDDIPFR